MMRFSRGAALVETAISVSLSLMLVLGAAQMALIGYQQVSTDGAAFIAAHEAAADPSASPAAVAHNVFNSVDSTQITSTPEPNAVGYQTQKSVPGFSMVPGLASSYTVGGGDVELAPSPPPAGGPTYAIGFTSTLFTYCMPSMTCSFPSSYTMYLAQTFDPNGNGVNGIFTEWGCHDGYFDKLITDFPSTMPTSITSGSALDPTTRGTDEYKIYSWDGGTACS